MIVKCAKCGQKVDTNDDDGCCGLSPVAYRGERKDILHSVQCPECGSWQGDMGGNVCCEACEMGSMPTADAAVWPCSC